MGQSLLDPFSFHFLTHSLRVVYSSQEPALPLHLQAVWGLDSSKVGLVFLAAVIPTLVCAFLLFNAFLMVGVTSSTR